MALYKGLDGYDKERGGNVEVLVQSFDVYGRQSRVLEPFTASVSMHPEFNYYRAGCILNGGKNILVNAAGYVTPDAALDGLLRKMALKYEDDAGVRRQLKGIIKKPTMIQSGKK